MICSYAAATDEQTLLNLWAAVFGDNWPLDAALLHREVIDVPTYLPGDHLLAEVDGQAVGFALTQVDQGTPPHGSLLALGVHPAYRRCGLGRALHKAALAHLRERGAEQVQLGAGALGYLWPGVPVDLSAAPSSAQGTASGSSAWPFFAGKPICPATLERFLMTKVT